MEEALNLNISDEKELGKYVINNLALKMRNKACSDAYGDLKEKYSEIMGGYSPFTCKLLDENEKLKHQEEFETRISVHFQNVTGRIVNSILYP